MFEVTEKLRLSNSGDSGAEVGAKISEWGLSVD
jgi:hypothetical protein